MLRISGRALELYYLWKIKCYKMSSICLYFLNKCHLIHKLFILTHFILFFLIVPTSYIKGSGNSTSKETDYSLFEHNPVTYVKEILYVENK